MKLTQKNNKILVKDDRHVIVGFVGKRANGQNYFAFGSPSAASYVAFDCENEQKGIEKIEEAWK